MYATSWALKKQPNGAVCILLKSNEIRTGSHSKYPETSSEFSANELMH